MKLIIAIILTLTVHSLKSQWVITGSEPGLFDFYNIRQMNMQDSTVLFYSGTSTSGNSQGIFYSIDGGSNFKYYTDLTSAWGNIYYLKFLKNDTLLIITSKGIIKQSPNTSDLPEFIIEYTDSAGLGYSSWTKFWGDSGIVNSRISYVTYDGGSNWKQLNDTPHKYFWGTKLEYIQSSGRMILLNQTQIYSSKNIGRAWDLLYDFYKVTNDPIKKILDISFINDSIGFFSAWGYIYRTLDGGKNWGQQSFIYPGQDLPSIKFFDSTTGYAIRSGESYIYVTSNGKTWGEEFNTQETFSLSDKFYYFNDSMFFVSNGTSLYKRSKLALGVKEPLNGMGIKPKITVYPNPAVSQITIRLSDASAFNYELFDLQGRRILSGKADNNEGPVSLEGIQPGLYVLNVRAEGFFVQSKIVKQ